jgi:hypothetical protein
VLIAGGLIALVATGPRNLISVLVLFVVAFMVGRSRLRDEQLEESMLRLEQAREMHDVLAHSLSGLVIQLEGVRSSTRCGPARSVTSPKTREPRRSARPLSG